MLPESGSCNAASRNVHSDLRLGSPQDLHCIHWSLPTSRPIIVSFLICTSEKSQSSWLNNLPPRGTLLERRVLSRPGLHVKASPSGKNGDKSTLIGLTLNQYSLI